LKKLSILMTLAMVMTVAGVASANTIIVPFFNDGGSLSTASGTGLRTYIRVKNLDSATIVCAVTYTDINGVDGTPGDNTFVLGPLATVGFRPVAADTAGEGPKGSLVPNATGGTFTSNSTGGVAISSTNVIVGAVYEENYLVGDPGGSGLAPAIAAP
jgi:hypothetical protein